MKFIVEYCESIDNVNSVKGFIKYYIEIKNQFLEDEFMKLRRKFLEEKFIIIITIKINFNL